jgi:hypothetical protein
MWSQTYGGPESDVAYSLIETSDGGYAMAGVSNSFGGFWLVKTDVNGNMLWNQSFGGADYDQAESVVQTSDGGYVIAGYTRSFGFGAGQGDFWLIKTDSNGNMEWNHTYGGQYDEWAYSVIETSDRGYAIAGRTAYLYPYIWLVKTDSNGNMEWNQTYGEGEAQAIVETPDGGFALTGGPYNAFLLETDSTGNMLWNKTYGGTADDRTYSLIATSDGGYALAGYTISFGAGLEDFWLIKTDGNGQKEWQKTYGEQNGNRANSLVQTSDGGYVLSGGSLLIKTDTHGEIEWNQTYSGSANSLVKTSDGGYAIAGEKSGDFWLAKTNEYGIIPEFPIFTSSFLLFIASFTAIIYKHKLIGKTANNLN